MIEIILDWPDSLLSPNARTNYRRVAEAKRLARQAAMVRTRAVTLGEFKQRGKSIPLSLVFCPPDKRPRDIDNVYASHKAALDGIADALGVNDKMFFPVTLNWGEVVPGGRVIVKVGK